MVVEKLREGRSLLRPYDLPTTLLLGVAYGANTVNGGTRDTEAHFGVLLCTTE